MKASTFIHTLEQLVLPHGDLEVQDDQGLDCDVEYWEEEGEKAFLVS